MSRTLKGSCHCGLVKYEANVSEQTALRCNCTFCIKPGFTCVFIPKADFKLISPPSTDELGDYQANNKPDLHRYFCPKCATHIVREGKYEFKGQWTDFLAFNLVTLDTPQDGLDFSNWKLEYFNGRHDHEGVDGKRGEPYKDGIV